MVNTRNSTFPSVAKPVLHIAINARFITGVGGILFLRYHFSSFTRIRVPTIPYTLLYPSNGGVIEIAIPSILNHTSSGKINSQFCIILFALLEAMFSYQKTVPDVVDLQPKRIIVVPDIHRDLEKAKRCLRAAGCLSKNGKWIGGNTVVVQIGDQIDGQNRTGKSDSKHICHEALRKDIEVLRFFNKLHVAAEKKGGAVYGLVGNHELMNVQGIFTYADTNGCLECENARRLAFQPGGEAARILATTRAVYLKIGRIVFVHAGFLPWHIEAMGNHPERLNHIMTDMLLGHPAKNSFERELFWRVCMDYQGALTNRNFSPDRHISLSETQNILKSLRADHMVIGHNVNPKGIVPLHLNLVFVCDPGLSKSLYDSRPQVLEITQTEDRTASKRQESPFRPQKILQPPLSFRVIYEHSDHT